MKQQPDKQMEQVLVAEKQEAHYPYGLCLSLDKKSLETLGVSAKDFEIGKDYMMLAKVRVKSVSIHQYGKESNEDVSLQIEQMEINLSDKKDAAKVLYGENN